MTEKKIGEIVGYLLNEGCEEPAVVNLEEMKEALKLPEDAEYFANLFASLERSGMVKIKYRKESDYCLQVLPKAKLFLNEKKREETVETELKITLPIKKIFWCSFFGSLLAGILVAAAALIVILVP